MSKLVFFLQIFFLFSCLSSGKTKNQQGSPEFRPSFYLGAYISNRTARSLKSFDAVTEELKGAGFNAFVIDVQPQKLPQETWEILKKHGIYPIARVVNFEGGLETEFPTPERLKSIKEAVRNACNLGFREINLDYIRYSDGGWKFRANFEKRYNNITGIIQEIRQDTKDACGSSVLFGGDIFGRVPFIENDAIGQRVENFSEVLDLLYPMLYPSHFYGLKERMNDPYTTVWDGIDKTQKRSRKGVETVAWIQGFKMHIGSSGLTYKDYIKVQMQASYDAKSRGFVVWNAHNEYDTTSIALKEFLEENPNLR
jgi:hypothetical protein